MKPSTRAFFYLKRLAITLFVLWIIGIGLTRLFSHIGSRKQSASYVSVKASNTWSRDGKLVKDFVNEKPPQYLIESDELYLLIDTVWNAILVMEGSHEEWDSKKIQELMKKEELRKYFPDPSADDGGVRWIPWPPRVRKYSDSP